MQVKNATQDNMDAALTAVNHKYAGNVTWNRAPERVSKNALRFTLRVKDSKEPGHRRHICHCSGTSRRSIHACWHVHGDFFDALFAIAPDAVIRSGGNVITAESGNWQDRNVGSQMYPVDFSDSCDCNA